MRLSLLSGSDVVHDDIVVTRLGVKYGCGRAWAVKDVIAFDVDCDEETGAVERLDEEDIEGTGMTRFQ